MVTGSSNAALLHSACDNNGSNSALSDAQCDTNILVSGFTAPIVTRPAEAGQTPIRFELFADNDGDARRYAGDQCVRIRFCPQSNFFDRQSLAPEHYRVTDLHRFMALADIDGEHVHGYPARQ